jgi:hypothetical protein
MAGSSPACPAIHASEPSFCKTNKSLYENQNLWYLEAFGPKTLVFALIASGEGG